MLNGGISKEHMPCGIKRTVKRGEIALAKTPTVHELDYISDMPDTMVVLPLQFYLRYTVFFCERDLLHEMARFHLRHT